MGRLVPGIEPGGRLLLGPGPQTRCHDARRTALGANCLAEARSSISTISKTSPGSSGSVSGPARPSFTLAGVIEIFSANAVSASKPTWALNPCTAGLPLCLTQCASSSPSLADAMMVASTSVPVLTRIALALSWAATASDRTLSSSRSTRALRKRTKAVRSGVGSGDGKPQKRRNEDRSSSVSANLTSDKSYQIECSSALDRANDGQAGSPLGALEISDRAAFYQAPVNDRRQSVQRRAARPAPVAEHETLLATDDATSSTSIRCSHRRDHECTAPSTTIRAQVS